MTPLIPADPSAPRNDVFGAHRVRDDGVRPGVVHVCRDGHEGPRARHHADRQLVFLAAQPAVVVHRVVCVPQQTAGVVRRARVRAGPRAVPLLSVPVAAQSRARAQAVRGALAGVQQQAYACLRRRPGIRRHEWTVLADQHPGRGRRAGDDGTARRIQRVLSRLFDFHRARHTSTRVLGNTFLSRTEHRQQEPDSVRYRFTRCGVRTDSVQSKLLHKRAVCSFCDHTWYGIFCFQDSRWTIAHQ